MNNSLITKSEKYVEAVLSERCPQNYRYHNFSHIKKVVDAAIIISENENINENEKEIVILACLFHDIGYIDICDGHETQSCNYARNFLKKENYPETKIQQIESCILATKIPQQPKNKLEMIVCDADLHHLGSDDYLEVGNNLRYEIEFSHKINFTNEGWLEKTIKFNKSHSYFTDYAKRVYGIKKELNVQNLEMLLSFERGKNNSFL
ncbi:HD domain-containing protein [Ignavibacterium album]|uniref:HD domain-containing protein n=1 Tax=Ignavibacterium album TaxID=591197 RepID=UPI0026F249C0|nr:HD domain-containing protein [Ignavibacterium album]